MGGNRRPGRALLAAVCALLCLSCLQAARAAAAEETVGYNSAAMSPRQTARSYGARLQETALGNLAADALRVRTGAEGALLRGGRLVRSLPEGPVTSAGIREIFDGEIPVVLIRIPAGQLFDLLEYGVSRVALDETECIDAASGFDGFLQISGFSFVYDPSQLPMGRVSSVTMDDGRRLSRDTQDTLILAVERDMTEGAQGCSVLEGIPAEPAGTAAELLEGYIRQVERVEKPPLGRVTVRGTMERTLYQQLQMERWLPYLILIVLLIRLPKLRSGSAGRGTER